LSANIGSHFVDHMIFYHGNHMHWHISATSRICGLIVWHINATSLICGLIVSHVNTTSITNTLIIQHVNTTSLWCQMLWCHNLESTPKCDKICAPTHLCTWNFAHVQSCTHNLRTPNNHSPWLKLGRNSKVFEPWVLSFWHNECCFWWRAAY
jgi:hypothetical protein